MMERAKSVIELLSETHQTHLHKKNAMICDSKRDVFFFLQFLENSKQSRNLKEIWWKSFQNFLCKFQRKRYRDKIGASIFFLSCNLHGEKLMNRKFTNFSTLRILRTQMTLISFNNIIYISIKSSFSTFKVMEIFASTNKRKMRNSRFSFWARNGFHAWNAANKSFFFTFVEFSIFPRLYFYNDSILRFFILVVHELLSTLQNLCLGKKTFNASNRDKL